ncbi:MAG TPA: phage tail sheath C-terminal domain-containing protein [Thermoanaerobaculia bacterium]|nr:phage tail sheath C-terminal domain-containing protein [Thermoanaerobaculia bacterium]
MSETIGEMILPGTYIEVRAEGLIGVGGIATGNVGVVGTANRGPVGEVQVLGSYSDALEMFGSYDRWPDGSATPTTPPLTLTRTLEQLFQGGASTVYAVRVANLGTASMATMSWTVESATNTALFTLTANSPGTWANAIVATVTTSSSGPPILTLVLGKTKETFSGATAAEMAQAVTDGSRFVTASGLANGSTVPASVVPSTTAGGPDGSPATSTEVQAGLDLLANQPVNLVVVGGLSVNDTGVAGTVLGHLDHTENDGRERIAVLGASSDTPSTILSEVVSNPRLVLVAPGIVATDAARAGEANPAVKLPAAYAAALVAGRLATLAPHVSLTNKDVPAGDLTTDYSRAQQKQLLGGQVLVLQKNLGIRVLKGITTDTEAFRQISVRRIVDYAKAGVRIGANPYIGRLNNVRVRAALKATLDGFLSGMVLDEMLTGYQLDVTATRPQEINGQAIVTMVLQPTFSIDFVKVIMNLQ